MHNNFRPFIGQAQISRINQMKRFVKVHVLLASLMCLVLLNACSSGGFAPGVGGQLKSIVITPSGPSVPLGETQQFTATAHYRDGKTADITASVAWASSNTGVATISASGLANTHSAGSITVSATMSGVTGQGTFIVGDAALVSIAVTPANSQLLIGSLNQFTATGTFTDQSTKDITSTVTWASSNTGVASVNGSGVVTAISSGTLTVSATSNSISGSTSATVQGSTLLSISIFPANGSIANGTTIQFHALGNYSDGSTQNITRQVNWTSSNTGVAQIQSNGQSKGFSPGTTTISATLGSVSGSTQFTVTNATIVSINVIPPGQTIAIGTTLDFSAAGHFSDGTLQDITNDSNWLSSNTAVATMGGTNTAAALSSGTTNISASFNGVTGSAPLTVSTATVTSISVTPATAEIAPNTIVSLVATATLSDGTTQDITNNATWSSSSTGVASVDTAGNVSGIAAGSATITAQFGGASGTSTITVASQLTSIQISPSSASIAAQTGVAFTATGTFSDGKTQDLTQFAYWTSSAPSVATVYFGNATGLSAGSSTIVALFDGVAGSAKLTVTGAKAVSVVVWPTSAAVERGASTKFKALATFNDGTIQDVTRSVNWTTSEQDVAMVTASGVARTVNAGSAAVTATMNGVSGAAVLSVH